MLMMTMMSIIFLLRSEQACLWMVGGNARWPLSLFLRDAAVLLLAVLFIIYGRFIHHCLHYRILILDLPQFVVF